MLLVIRSRRLRTLPTNRVGLCRALLAGVTFSFVAVFANGATRFAGATSSQPLALTADDSLLAVVNPDNNSVSFFDVRQDRNRLLAEVPVQTEANGAAAGRIEGLRG